MAVLLLINSDARRIPLRDKSVNCIVTSPPYYNLRDYSVENQLGLEATPEEYVANMVAIGRELYRVLKDDGTFWLVIGDCFINKQLCFIPARVAMALQHDGWFVRMDNIWHKLNPMPSSAKDRTTPSHEYVFHLSKQAQYYYDYQAILEPANYDGRKDTKYKGAVKNYQGAFPDGGVNTMIERGHERWPNRIRGYKTKDDAPHNQHHGQDVTGYTMPPIGGKKSVDAKINPTYSGNTPISQMVNGIPARNKRSVWSVPTASYPGSHFATYPGDLIEPCILAGCPEGGVVLDPFNGTGTTCMVARKHRRIGIGLDLNFDYLTTESRKRLQYGSYVPVDEGVSQLTLGG